MTNTFAALNGSDTLLGEPIEEETAAETALRRVLSRLGEYTAQIIGPLNMRPTNTLLLKQSPERVEVRVSTSSTHVLLVIAPDGDLTSELFFLRTLAGKNLPLPRLIAHDQSRSLVPFDYAIQNYIGGRSLNFVDNPPLVTMVGRQLGRVLRRVHQHAVPTAGFPLRTGRWPNLDWLEALRSWLEQRGALAGFADFLDSATLDRFIAATLDHPQLAIETPTLIHGAVTTTRAIVTIGEAAQLEALVRPGPLVGGDPLFDLALALQPAQPEPFRRGVLEGYTSGGGLAKEQEQRLRRLWLLVLVADAVVQADRDELARLPAIIQAELEVLTEV